MTSISLCVAMIISIQLYLFMPSDLIETGLLKSCCSSLCTLQPEADAFHTYIMKAFFVAQYIFFSLCSLADERLLVVRAELSWAKCASEHMLNSARTTQAEHYNSAILSMCSGDPWWRLLGSTYLPQCPWAANIIQVFLFVGVLSQVNH